MNLPANGHRAVPHSRGEECHSCARDCRTRGAHDMFISSPIQLVPQPNPCPEPHAAQELNCRLWSGKREPGFPKRRNRIGIALLEGSVRPSTGKPSPRSSVGAKRERIQSGQRVISLFIYSFALNLRPALRTVKNETANYVFISNVKASKRNWSSPGVRFSER